MKEDHQPILEIRNLSKSFTASGTLEKLSGKTKYVRAVNNVSFQLNKGEVYGLVGESGSGKSTLARTILQLTKPSSGEVLYKNQDLTALKINEMRKLRKDLQLIFQDPFSSLNPRKTVGQILEEPLRIHGVKKAAIRQEKALALLEQVGLQTEHYFRYPHEFSGGQRQRIGIARALIVDPEIAILDEPVSALDVSIQSQILNILKALQKNLNLTMLFIAHDISVVRYISDRIGVLYLGEMMEEADTDSLFAEPLHPYTQALFSSVLDGSKKERIPLKGEIPSPLAPPSGCVFHTRCPFATELCKEQKPKLREVRAGQRVACHFVK